MSECRVARSAGSDVDGQLDLASVTNSGRSIARCAVAETREVRDLTDGRLVMLVDEAGRGQGILIGVAALMCEETACVMAIHARGLLSVTVGVSAAFRLGLRRMPGAARAETEYLASIEAARCLGTGISAADRAMTMRTAGARNATEDDLVSPGHVMPLLVREGRPPATLPEIAHAIVTRRCGYPAASWCDVLNEAGDLASCEECLDLARRLGVHAARFAYICTDNRLTEYSLT